MAEEQYQYQDQYQQQAWGGQADAYGGYYQQGGDAAADGGYTDQAGYYTGFDASNASQQAYWKQKMNEQKEAAGEVVTDPDFQPTVMYEEPSSMVSQATQQQGDYSASQYYNSGVEVPNIPYWNAVTNEPVYAPGSNLEYETPAEGGRYALDPVAHVYRNTEDPTNTMPQEPLEKLISKYEAVEETIVEKVKKKRTAKKMQTLDRLMKNQHAPVLEDPEGRVSANKPETLPFGLRKKLEAQQRRQCCSFA